MTTDFFRKISKSEFEAELENHAAALRRKIELELDGITLDESTREQMAQAFIDGDFQQFCSVCFPHYIQSPDYSEFQQFAMKQLPEAIMDAEGARYALAAPRGEAKSTICSQLLVLWCIVTNRKHFIIIIMDAFDQAAMMLEAIKVELEMNPILAFYFPDAVGQGKTWQSGDILTRGNVKVQVAGSGKKIRGRRHGEHRPDLVVLDDIENDENVRKKEQRDKTESWVRKAVMKLGSADGSMDIIYIGTLLHYDSVLNRFIGDSLWLGKVFSALIKYPDRMDLWDQWEEILRNDGLDAAAAFYKKRKKLMDAGSKVSWPSMRPLIKLMKERVSDRRAFDTELQNDPGNDENAPFKDIKFWVQIKRDWVFYGSCDPSLGRKNKNRDPSAILIGGYDRENMVLDVVEARVARIVPNLQIKTMIDLQREYKCLLWGVESVQFQEFFAQVLMDTAIKAGVVMPVRGIQSNTDKDLRIMGLQPFVASGQIRLHTSQTTMIEQLRYYPEADHDDAPDALEMLWQMATSNAGSMPNILTPKNRRNRGVLHGR